MSRPERTATNVFPSRGPRTQKPKQLCPHNASDSHLTAIMSGSCYVAARCFLTTSSRWTMATWLGYSYRLGSPFPETVGAQPTISART